MNRTNRGVRMRRASSEAAALRRIGGGLLCLLGVASNRGFLFGDAFQLPRQPWRNGRGRPSSRGPVAPSESPPPSPSSTSLSLDLGGVADALNRLPFEDLSSQLSDALDIGAEMIMDAQGNSATAISEAETTVVLESVGRDLLVFLASSVLVTLGSTALGTSPILGYLVAGAALGPHGLDMFSNAKADVELGDFGILFLLFSEGLEVSTQRLRQLSNYLPLGFAQISLTTGVITAAILLGAPQFLDRFLPLDEGFIDVQNPTEAVVLALAGTLSTSAFIFPVLKERGWEGEPSGQAATSILLLQDLFVAPLLVVMPFVVGRGPTDFAAIGFLTAKAAVGFGLVMYAGSFLLQRVFNVVAATRSTETFVALSLLVSVGMGMVAKGLGLTDTAGAFAAGVLLANTNFRAQIQADVLPFKGILLGIFFMDAGSLFDTELVLAELPTVITGAMSLILLKALTVAAATRVPRWMEPNRLEFYDAIKLSFLLSGGGEFAFVVLALAEKLEVLPKDLGGLLTAIVLITMAVTPLLGSVASVASKYFVTSGTAGNTLELEESQVAQDAVVICGYGEIGKRIVNTLGVAKIALEEYNSGYWDLPQVVAFDTRPSLINNILMPESNVAVMYGNGENPEVLKSHGAVNPRAIFVSYEDHERVMAATSRLRTSFIDTPIYTRAHSRQEALELRSVGATEVIVEMDELARTAPYLLMAEQNEQKNGDKADVDLTQILNLLKITEASQIR